MLVIKGGLEEFTSEQRQRLLETAVIYNNVGLFERLLVPKVDVTYKNAYGDSLLHIAALQNGPLIAA